MKRKDYSRILIYVLIVVTFNMLFFINGKDDGRTVTWISYVFVHIGFLVSCFAPFICINYKRIPENLVTIYLFAWIYCIASLVMNSVFIIAKIDKIRVCVFLNILLLVVYIVQLIINVNINYTVEKNIEVLDAERQFIHDVSNKLKLIMQIVKSYDTRVKIEKVYDALKTSPVHSNDKVINIEIEIMRLVDELEEKIESCEYEDFDSIINLLLKNIQKRNSLL